MSPQQEYQRKYYLAHRDDKIRSTLEYQRANPQKRALIGKRHKLKKYGLTVEQYEGMVALQEGKCAICRKTPTGDGFKGALHVDHNHATGRVRKLLCFNCNLMVGNAKESPEILRAAATYMERE